MVSKQSDAVCCACCADHSGVVYGGVVYGDVDGGGLVGLQVSVFRGQGEEAGLRERLRACCA